MSQIRTKNCWKDLKRSLLGALLIAAPAVAQAQYTYTTNADDTLTITGYTGPSGAVVIPSTINGLTVTIIGSNAFATHYGLTNVTIPSSVTGIGSNAFSSCYGLNSVAIPYSVTNIGSGAFGRCLFMTAITVDAQNASYSSTNGVLFDKDQKTIVQCPSDIAGGSYTIPNGVTNIEADGFFDCNVLTSLTIPNSVTSIGAGAFGNCGSLTSLTIPGGVTNVDISMFEESDGFSDPSSVYFTGNAPSFGCSVLNPPGSPPFGEGIPNFTVFYLPGTTGWAPVIEVTNNQHMFYLLQTELWNPLIQACGASFGVQSNQFGFNITGTNNFTVVVEACANLAIPAWTPLQTVTLTNGSYYFSDPQWTNYPNRFYGLGLP